MPSIIVKPESVIIDGVRYVPVSEASIDAAKLMRALAAHFWGRTAEEIDDPATYRELRVFVTDDYREGTGDSIEAFVAHVLQDF